MTLDENSPPWSPHPKYAGCLVDQHGYMVADCTTTSRDDAQSAFLAAAVMRAVNTFAALVGTLKGLIEAVELDAKEKGISGFTGARLSDARQAVQLAELP